MFRPSCRGEDSTKPSSLDVLGQPLQQPEAELRAGLLTSAEHDGDLDLVPGTQEPDDVTLLGLVVVRVDLRPQLHLFDDRVGLVPAGLARLLRGLVLVLAEIHQLADGRPGCCRDLDEVEIGLLCQPKCVLDPDDAYLLTVRSDQSHLGNADALVDAQFNGDGSSWVVLVLVPPRDHRKPLENTKASVRSHEGPIPRSTTSQPLRVVRRTTAVILRISSRTSQRDRDPPTLHRLGGRWPSA